MPSDIRVYVDSAKRGAEPPAAAVLERFEAIYRSESERWLTRPRDAAGRQVEEQSKANGKRWAGCPA